MKILALNIVSDIKPAGGGCLPCRISIHEGEGCCRLVTHLEAQQEDTGNWARMQGHYFHNMVDAWADYEKRCEQLGVEL